MLMAVGALLAWPAQAAEDGPPPVLPYRPSVSSPAALPAPGQLEMEVGGLRSRDADTRRASLPMLLKLAFNEEWGVLLGGEAWISARAPDSGRQRGVGDLTATLKRALRLDEASVLGLELSAKAPTARDGLGSGKSDYGLNGIYSRDFGSLHLDANLNLQRLAGWTRARGGCRKACRPPFPCRWPNAGGRRRNCRARSAMAPAPRPSCCWPPPIPACAPGLRFRRGQGTQCAQPGLVHVCRGGLPAGKFPLRKLCALANIRTESAFVTMSQGCTDENAP
ncbi:transporter [Massilia sp. MB5]|uniref:transporter n=1 Tax=Massilia sp. MB5 TaxID=2919578 RepID=UPI001F1108AF|nr:transporter [Massilia sp. MB5]UMR28914.1 transporter [Massilia sp. MB5]